MSAATLQILMSNAQRAGGPQLDHADCLGGFWACTPIEMLVPNRFLAMPSIEILDVAAENGVGLGILEAISVDTIRWTAPGESTAGATVTILNGEEQTLFANDLDKYIVIRRTSATDLSGTETVQLLNVFNNCIGGSDFDETEAAVTKYRAFFVRNDGATDITALTVWLGDAAIAGFVGIGVEAPTAGAIQIIANEETAPAAISFSSPTTEGTGIVIGTLTAGSTYGIWLKIDYNEATINLVDLAFSFTFAAVDSTARAAGAFTGQTAGQYEFYSETVDIDPETHSPKVTQATLPLEYTASYTVGTYNEETRFRNRDGLLSPSLITNIVRIDAAGEELNTPPSAPSEVDILPGTAGIGVVQALYNSNLEADTEAAIALLQATHWAVWITDDDTTPDTTAHADHAEAITTPSWAYLTHETDAAIDAAPIKTIVRARRVDDGDGTSTVSDVAQLPASGAGTIESTASLADWGTSGLVRDTDDTDPTDIEYCEFTRALNVLTISAANRALNGSSERAGGAAHTIEEVLFTDSENTTVVETEATLVGPERVKARAMYGQNSGVTFDPEDGPDTTETLDVTTDTRIVMKPGYFLFYTGTPTPVLIWALWYDSEKPEASWLYVPSDVWTLIHDESALGAGNGDLVEVVSATELYVNVGPGNGTRRIKIDLTAGEIRFAAIQTQQTVAGTPAEDVALWQRFADTRFQVFSVSSENWLSGMFSDSNGILTLKVPVNRSLTQALIEALT